MEFPQERLATALHQKLQQELTGKGIQSWLHGSGMQWHCLSRKAQRDCAIYTHAFETLAGQEGDYLVMLEESGHRIGEGRTRSMDEAVALVNDWCSRAELRDIHARYAFVDKQRRALKKFQKEVLELQPLLAMKADSDLLPGVAEHCELDLWAGDRSCLVSFFGEDELPRLYFQEDECVLLSVQCGDVPQDALMLRRWLADRVSPSTLAQQFPELKVEPVARYYEEGRGVEGEFILSWDEMERFYRKLEFSDTEEVLALIASMRRAGFDRKLRAGQSLYTLVLSRSRRHGLRAGQPSLRFEFGDEKMQVTPRMDDLSKLAVSQIRLTPEVTVLLNHLVEKPID